MTGEAAVRANDAVAAMLQEFADLLAISGNAPLKVRAYEKAARAVQGCPIEVDQLDSKGLDAIPNVGSHLTRKILEFLDTGSVAELDELRAQVPAGLRTLLSVPGLGPKHAYQVYAELGITSLSELTKALEEHRIQKLRGWGQKSGENLARAIRETGPARERLQLRIALDLAEQLREELDALPLVHRVAYAGSLRRMRDMVGDIDLLVASEHPEHVMAAVVTLPQAARVLAHGPTKTSVLTTSGAQVDVRVVQSPSWGAALIG
jgi:DNA polymerase (family X)